MPDVLVKHLGYKSHKGGKAARGMKSIKAHIKYIENRENEDGEREKRELFNSSGETNRKDFYNILKNQTDKGVIAHKFVFSMERSNFENKNIDYKELTRDIMSGYESKIGRELNWVACIHDKQSNPHVHIVIAGRDTQGKEVVFMPTQLKQLKNISEKECERHTERSISRNQEQEFDFNKQIEHERSLEPPINERIKSIEMER